MTAPAAAPAVVDGDESELEEEERVDVGLASMDIFAGCGGLSEGMHQASVLFFQLTPAKFPYLTLRSATHVLIYKQYWLY
jgi:hypothetical protein